jgi:hypothetical protein
MKPRESKMLIGVLAGDLLFGSISLARSRAAKSHSRPSSLKTSNASIVRAPDRQKDVAGYTMALAEVLLFDALAHILGVASLEFCDAGRFRPRPAHGLSLSKQT